MTKQSKMLQLLTQIKRDFDIGEPRFPHLKLKVSDINPKQDAIELYIRAKDILWNSNLSQRQVADIILDLGAAVQLKDGKNILQEIVSVRCNTGENHCIALCSKQDGNALGARKRSVKQSRIRKLASGSPVSWKYRLAGACIF